MLINGHDYVVERYGNTSFQVTRNGVVILTARRSRAGVRFKSYTNAYVPNEIMEDVMEHLHQL